MTRLVPAATVALLVWIHGFAAGQGFQARGLRSQPSADSAPATSVSPDLLQIYEQTHSAKNEATITAIARACSKVVPDASRSQADRDYAASLFAWALNRRGELRNEQAAQLVAKGQLDDAAKLDNLATDDFKTAIQYGPDSWRTHHNYAISLAMNGDYSQAISELTRTIELKPDYANAYFNRGELHFELEEFPEALRDYGTALEYNAGDPQYYNSRGHCQFMLKAYEPALSDYRRAAELAGDSAVYLTDLADACQVLGRWEEAAKSYRAAIALNSQYPRAYQNAAWLMATCPEARIRNIELANSTALKAIELGAGRTPQTLDTLAAATAAAGKHSEAAKLVRQALAMSSDPQERDELVSRLKLYERGQAYLQSEVSEAVRTASSSAPNK